MNDSFKCGDIILLVITLKLRALYFTIVRIFYLTFGSVTEGTCIVFVSGISMLAHDCAASACWHYGEKEAFVLRARQYIKKGDEITISYVGDDDLFKSTSGECQNADLYIQFCLLQYDKTSSLDGSSSAVAVDA